METQYRITPEKAKNQIGEIFQNLDGVEKLTLNFTEGYYSWEQPLVLDEAVLGNTEIVLKAEGNVIFSGSRNLAGNDNLFAVQSA